MRTERKTSSQPHRRWFAVLHANAVGGQALPTGRQAFGARRTLDLAAAASESDGLPLLGRFFIRMQSSASAMTAPGKGILLKAAILPESLFTPRAVKYSSH